MAEPRDECREVTLPSGEPVRYRGSGELSPEAVAALGELVDAARAWHAAEHPEDPAATALWRRLRAVADARGLLMREVAHECGVRPSVVTRIAQGYMPDGHNLAAIERWLTSGGTDA
jgi:hypothetical protein